MVDSFLDADLTELLRKGYAELEQALHFEEVAQRQLDFAQQKVARLTSKILQLSIASDDEKLMSAIKETGLSDAIRTVLKASDHHLTAPEIRDRLEQIGYDVSEDRYQNFLATLYLTLQRLEKQGEVHAAKFEGKNVYAWQSARDDNPLVSTVLKSGHLTKRQQRRLQEARDKERFLSVFTTPKKPNAFQALAAQKATEAEKPKPAWWKSMTANGTQPLDYSRLTPTQRREARELGLVKRDRNAFQETVRKIAEDEKSKREKKD